MTGRKGEREKGTTIRLGARLQGWQKQKTKVKIQKLKVDNEIISIVENGKFLPEIR